MTGRRKNNSDSYFMELISIIKIGTWDWDLATNHVTYSPQWAEILGYEPGELSPDVHTWERMVLPEDLKYANEQIGKHLYGQTPTYEAEFRMVRKDGSIIWAQDKGKVLEFGADGQPLRLVGVLQDVSRLKNTETNLRESRAALDLAVNAASLGTWDWDISGNCIKYNDEYLHMLGYTQDDINGSIEEWENMNHPDDLPHTVRVLDDYINGKIPSYECEIRMKHKDGHYIWTKDVGRILERDRGGVPTRVIGGHLNIDPFKRAQGELGAALDELSLNKQYLESEIEERTEHLIKQDQMLWNVNEIAKKLLSYTDESFDDVVHDCLELVGKITNQNRVYIWKDVEMSGKLCCVQVYEWVRGAEPIQGIPEFENVPYEMLPNFRRALETGECLNNFVRNLSKAENQVLGPQGIKTILIAPVSINGTTWGFIGVDNCEEERYFSELEENMLLMSGFLMANAILKRTNDEKVREAEQRVQVMFNATPLCCNLWSEDFENIACNDEAVRLFGLSSQQEYLGRFFDLSPEYQPCGTLSSEKASTYIKRAFNEGYCKFEWLHQNLQHEPVPSEITLVRVQYKDGYRVAGYTQDLREAKETAEKMKEAEERIQLMFNATPLGCNLISKDFQNVIACNDEAVRMFGLSSQEEYTDRFFDLSPEYQPCGTRSVDKSSRYIEKVLSEGYCRFEWVHQKPDGEEIPSDIILVRIKHKNDYAIAGYIRDLREIKAMLREIHNAEEELRATRDEALAHSRAKSEFLAKMSHEIRTPMNAIVGMSELILRESIPPAAKEHAVSIKQASANLLAIINDILDFSKIESGRLELANEKYMLSSIINDVISIIRIRVMDSNLLFITNVDANLPDLLMGDEIRLRQIILNVLSNAVKYTKEGYISLSVTGTVTEDDTVMLGIDISDSGLGIKEEDLHQLFDEFMQFDVAKNKGVEGTGLGLAITKNLCVAMGGDITAKSVYGHGSTFTVTVPQKIISHQRFAEVRTPEAHSVLLYEPREIYLKSMAASVENLNVRYRAVTNQSELQEALVHGKFSHIFFPPFLCESAKAIMDKLGVWAKLIVITDHGESCNCPVTRITTNPLHAIPIANILNDVSDELSTVSQDGNMFVAPGARVLIVDDISTNLKVAEGLMAPYDMTIDTCENGFEAIEAVNDNDYDIVFMDHMMPGMNGIEATLAIRELEKCKDTPIVALTANAVSGVKEMFLSNGFSDFLAKPIDLVKLNEILERWIPASKKAKYSPPAARDEETTPVFKIDGVNVAMGIAMTGGSLENYLRVLLMFYKDGVDKIRELGKCLENGHISLFTIHVHALKSALASIGATELSGDAKALEAAGAAENVIFIRNNSGAFLESMGRLLDNLKYVIKTGAPEQAGDDTSIEAVREQLAMLKTALEEMDGTASDEIINELAGFNVSAEMRERIDRIANHVLLCDYDDAIGLIDEIITY